jgi:hypothetical protein
VGAKKPMKEKMLTGWRIETDAPVKHCVLGLCRSSSEKPQLKLNNVYMHKAPQNFNDCSGRL